MSLLDDLQFKRSKIEPGVLWKAVEIGLDEKMCQTMSRKRLRKMFRIYLRHFDPYLDEPFDWDN